MQNELPHGSETNHQDGRKLADHHHAADRDVRLLDENPAERGGGAELGGDVQSGRAKSKGRKSLAQLIAGDHGWFKIANLAIVLFAWWAVFQIPGPPPLWTVYVPAYVGLTYFTLVLLPFNVMRARIGGKAWMKPLAQITRWRRTLGLMAAAWFFLHFSAAVNYMRESYSVELLRERYEPATNPGMAALLVFFVLFVTSYGWAKKLLGSNWKRLQSLTWYCVPLILVHSIGAKWAFDQSFTHISLVLLIGILGFAAVEFGVLSKAGDKDRWRHPFMLACGLIAALIVRFAPIA
jgi:DMSO/TMAO reductase YedYZ heme-binding membrane subunit